METPNNLEAAFERQLDSLGKALEGTIEQWREAESVKREELSSQIKALETAIGEVKENLAEESRAHLHGIEVAKNGERDAFSLARACRAIARKDFCDAPYEQEVFAATKEKAMSSGVDPAGGYVVPEESLSQVIELLRARVVAYDLGARDLMATGIPLTIPRLTTGSVGYWVSENSAITASDLGFEQINMTPKTVAGRVILSNLLLETSTPTADQIIQEDLAAQLGVAMDVGILDGIGAAGQPTGIMNTAGIASVAMMDLTPVAAGIGAPPTIASMLEFVSDLDGANAPAGKRGWAIHPLGRFTR